MMMKIINLIEINMITTKGIMIRDHIKKKFHRSRIIESQIKINTVQVMIVINLMLDIDRIIDMINIKEIMIESTGTQGVDQNLRIKNMKNRNQSIIDENIKFDLNN